ncbi:hypothetical protein Godav_014127 [Gossypium davidsonii]|uniref:Bet v I/Major latex protein domain-containing protein n=1 Tax=Gossypium davidsonii TaxID=34287 RepID=A0A7J8RIS2_GOSDV|nr:hypothetical protein [Gossypium davidsonii]
MLPGVCQQPFCLFLPFSIYTIANTAMASSGQLHVDFELKSPAEKVWGTIRDSTTIFPQALSHDYKSIQVLEGDGKAPGSVRLINYAEGSPIVKVSKERIESVDEAEKKYVYSIIDGDLLKYYKTFFGKIIVVPKGESSLVKWSCEFEKASEEIPDPSVIKEFAVKNFKEIDDYLHGKA